MPVRGGARRSVVSGCASFVVDSKAVEEAPSCTLQTLLLLLVGTTKACDEHNRESERRMGLPIILFADLKKCGSTATSTM